MYRANRSAAQKAEELKKRREARQEQTPEERAAVNKKRQEVRQNQTTEAREAAKEKQKTAMAKSRAAQTAEEREAINKNLQAARSKQAPAVREAAKERQKAAMAKSRAAQTSEEREAVNKKQQVATAKLRQSRQKVEKKEGLKTEEILAGTHPVPDLKDSPDSIGNMEIVCNNCGAFKFRKETGSTCCSNGKVYLDPLPQPPDQIRKLWHEDTPEGRLFRQHA